MAKNAIRSSLVDQMLCSRSVNTAWQWLCNSRTRFPAHADIWHLRFHRARLLPALLDAVRHGHYRFSPMQVIHKADGTRQLIWSAQDALVIKLMAQTLRHQLPLHPCCTHIKGHGGHKYAVRQTHQRIQSGRYCFVCQTDIRHYYASINKTQLFELICARIHCPVMRMLLYQFLHYSIEDGGNFYTPPRGIPRGSAIGPLLAGFHLYTLDKAVAARTGIRYLRYMDDLLILAPSRWQLKQTIARMNQELAAAGLQQQPDKTFIGRISTGFNWLGYRFDNTGICGPAPSAVLKHRIKLRRLSEQARRCAQLQQAAAQQRVVEYQKRWGTWLTAGIDDVQRVSLLLHQHIVGKLR